MGREEPPSPVTLLNPPWGIDTMKCRRLIGLLGEAQLRAAVAEKRGSVFVGKNIQSQDDEDSVYRSNPDVVFEKIAGLKCERSEAGTLP